MKRVLILVENLPSPFDRRVWQEATALAEAGYSVSIICPTGKGCEERYEEIDGIAIHRYRLPVEASGALGYALEYSIALFWSFVLSLRVAFGRGFDIVHACNPPDLFFLIGAFYKLFGRKFVFDHHDINPELYEAKFGRRDRFWKLMLALERMSFVVSAGEFAAVLGPNGSGKTTLLRTLGGIRAYAQGSIYYGTRDLKNMSAAERASFQSESYAARSLGCS